MINTLFIGTGNEHKKQEIKSIFENNGFFVDIKTPKDFNDDSDPIEDGTSFKENAIIKAKFYHDKYNMPCLAEDSGITIEYFNNFPGIHSKRFLGNLSDFDKNEYILDLMKGIKNRNAVFHCVICYIDENGKYNIFEGKNHGEISYEQKGNKGFGYDPIFLIPEFNKTEAELGEEYKNKFGHRAKAFDLFINYLKNDNK